MDDIFNKFLNDSQVLNEAIFELPKSVFQNISNYILEIYKKVNTEKIKKINADIIPPKIFPLDFTGTRWEYLNIINPRVQIDFNNQKGETYFTRVDLTKKNKENIKNGIGFINISFTEPISRILVEALEHELLHFVQYAIVTYKIKKGIIPDISISDYEKHIGGLPSKKFIPIDVSIAGYKNVKKKWCITNPEINARREVLSVNNKILTITAPTAEKALAIAKARYSFIDQKYPNSFAKQANVTTRRTAHTNRPIEYYTDLLTLIRQLQYAYYKIKETDSGKNLDKKMFFRDFLNGTFKNISILSTPYALLDRFKSLKNTRDPRHNGSLYKTVLIKLYKIFIHTDPKEDLDKIKVAIEDTVKEINMVNLKKAFTPV